MWVGTAKGLHRIHQGHTNSWLTLHGLPHDDVRAIFEDRQGRIWIGTDGGGLAQYASGSFERLGQNEGLGSARVWALCEDAEGILWMGTDRGVGFLDRGRMGILTRVHGLPVNLVNGLVDDYEGYLWVGHDNGIFRARRSELIEAGTGLHPSVSCVGYDDEDGLRSLETNGQKSNPSCLRLGDGRIAFAMTAGVALFDPKRLPDLTCRPVVRIEAVIVGGRGLFTDSPGSDRLLDGIHPFKLGHSLGRQVEIGFNAPQFLHQEGLRFEYRLLGLDSRWYASGEQHRVTYPLSLPGNYLFEVRAMNAHGHASSSPARVAFVLEPRFLERTSVRLGLTVLIVLAVGVGVRWRLGEVRRMHRLEYEAVTERERRRLARDLHDGLGSSLTEINLLSDRLAQPDADAVTGHGPRMDLGEALRQRSLEAMDALRELIWATNPQADTLESLVARLCDQTEHAARAAGLRCRFKVPDDYPAMVVSPAFRREVVLALREAVNNVIRHARANELKLGLAVATGSLTLSLVDDGSGFSCHESPTRALAGNGGVGLHSMEDRIRRMGGRFELRSQPANGTTVTFVLPLPQPPSESPLRS